MLPPNQTTLLSKLTTPKNNVQGLNYLTLKKTYRPDDSRTEIKPVLLKNYSSAVLSRAHQSLVRGNVLSSAPSNANLAIHVKSIGPIPQLQGPVAKGVLDVEPPTERFKLDSPDK